MRGTGGGEDYDTFAAFFEMRDGKFGEKERSLDETVIGCVPNLRSNILQFLANIVKTGIMVEDIEFSELLNAGIYKPGRSSSFPISAWTVIASPPISLIL